MILIRSIQEKSCKNVNVCFNILVLHLMLLMRGEEDKSYDEGQEQVVDTQDTQIIDRVTRPPPLTHCRRPTPGKRMCYDPNKKDAIEEKLLKIIEKPVKQPDEDEIFCLSLATSLKKIKDPQRKEYTKLQL